MENLDNVRYDKINLTNYERRIQNLIKNETIKKIGLKITKLGRTYYNYPIELIEIGKGNKEIFIVGGTHSSEIITVDFVTQLLNNVQNLENFDPNIFKLSIIPIQNPEGFDINTSLLESIQNINFENKSKEYYLRYRTDSIIYNVLKDLNKIPPEKFRQNLKYYINTSKNWKELEKKEAMPKIELVNKIIKKEQNTIKILETLQELEEKLDKKDIHDAFLIEFIKCLTEIIIEKEINLNDIPKLHQQMFENTNINQLRIRNKNLKDITEEIYKQNPNGSIINHDPTGLFINLNANQPTNPGIEIIKNNQIKYMTGTKSNIRNYYKGPMGIPCSDPNNFEYAIENKILYNTIKKSQENNNYLATLLYHGTGGMIYYKPNNENYLEYNQKLADEYNDGISKYKNDYYNKIEETSITGYGDLLRKEFPGVLLIELSKMGGNPIGPYGDKMNIYRTVNENIYGIDNLLKYLKKQLLGNKYTK